MNMLLIDDEPVARRRLRKLLEAEGVAGDHLREAESVKHAVQLLHQKSAEVLFLDIEMPVLNGFDLLDLLPEPRPFIVFVTAYDQFAVRAFEYAAFDYLTKPVETERLQKLLTRLEQGRSQAEAWSRMRDFLQTSSSESADRLFWRAEGEKGQINRQKLVASVDIPYVEADGGQVTIVLEKTRFRRDESLDELEKKLNPLGFLRIHRSFLVNRNFVAETRQFLLGEHTLTLKDGSQLPVSRRKWTDVKRNLGG